VVKKKGSAKVSALIKLIWMLVEFRARSPIVDIPEK
jgi:hypothetical protein